MISLLPLVELQAINPFNTSLHTRVKPRRHPSPPKLRHPMPPPLPLKQPPLSPLRLIQMPKLPRPTAT